MDADSQRTVEAESRFAQSDGEAVRRFEKYESVDPYPDIPPALLNWADIEDYVAATGMIWPFYPSAEKSKPASYEVDLLGKCVYWDKEGEKRIKILQKGDEFRLERNSIAFVTLEPMFRLPDYIALRFNLKITHVYRGILLGTGPLVDPGYKNKLSIPLHNLTTNDYTFRGGDPLIWMEFTKLSPNRHQQLNDGQGNEPRRGEFQERKNKLSDVEDYLHKADPHRPIRSSIPEVILSAQSSAELSAQASKDAAKSAKDVADKAESLRFRATLGGIVSGLVFLIALVAVVFQVYSLTQDAISYVKQNAQILNEEQKERFQNLEREIQSLKQQLENLTKSSAPSASLVPSSTETLTKDATRDK